MPDTLPELPSLEPVPLGLPAALLDRRPDLRQAEMQLAASTYGVGAAIANLYPDLSLTGSAGVRSDTLTDIISIDGLVYNVDRVMEECLAIKPDLVFLWDEAWFAFARFSPTYRQRTAMRCGNNLRKRLRTQDQADA